MKRLLAFLALFGIGLALLLWYQRRTERLPVEPPQVRPGLEAPFESASPAPLPADVAGPDEPLPPGSGLLLRGPLRVQHFRERSATEKVVNALLTTADTRTLPGGAIEGQGVHVDLFDEQGTALQATPQATPQATIDAPRALLPIDPESRGLMPRMGDLVTLFDPAITIESGGVFAPLACRAEELECDLEQRALAAAGSATVEGRGLTVSGRGMALQIGTQRLTFASEGRVLAELAGEAVELVSAGPLSIEERADAPGSLRIRGQGGTRIASLGARAWALSGDVCEVVAVHPEGSPRGGELRLESLLVDGHVSLAVSGASVEGQRANAVVDADGRVSGLLVEGVPRAHIPAGLMGQDLAELGAAEAVLTGAGPLHLGLGGVALPALRMSGPGALECGEATLSAAEILELSGSPPRLVARGAVTLERRTERLEAPEIELSGEGDEGLRARTAGPARLVSASAGGGFELQTTGALELAGAGSSWTVPLAQGVTLAVLGDAPWSAHAQRVSDFVPQPLGFVASGQVDFESPEGRGGGEELSVRGTEDLELRGRAGSLAWFEGPAGRANALRIVRRGELLRAEGSVEAVLREMKLSADIRADTLEFQLGDAAGPGGTTVRTLVFDARATGDAPLFAALHQEDGSSEFECRALSGKRNERWLAGALLSATTEIAGRDVLRATVEQNSDQWQLAAREIDARAVYQEELTRASFDARGAVLFERQGLRGTAKGGGERLQIDGDRRGRLEALPGERVWMAGRLARSAHDYELEADALDFTEEYVEAARPVLVLRRDGDAADGEGNAGQKGEEVPALDMLRAHGRWLSVVGDEVELLGAAHFDGRLSDGTEWVLDSERAEALIDARATHGMDQLARLAAHEHVEFRLGAAVRAAGAEFVFEGTRRVLRVDGGADGSTARVEIAGLAWESAWLEFDLAIRSIRTGPGRAWPLATSVAPAARGADPAPEPPGEPPREPNGLGSVEERERR